MMKCSYVYCRSDVDEQLTDCPVCGHSSHQQDPQLVFDKLQQLKAKLPARIIDMHQIIHDKPEAVAQQIKIMNLLHIEKALLQSAPDNVYIMGNKKLANLAKEYPDLFFISHFLDPRMHDLPTQMDLIEKQGIKVVKVNPAMGYYPDDPRWDSFWRQLNELKMTIMVHTGFITARHVAEERKTGIILNSKYCNPIHFDSLARKFPQLTFILCHCGGSLYYQESMEMIWQHQNVWADFAGSGIFALQRLLQQQIPIYWEKVFWGNDSLSANYLFNLNLLYSVLAKHGLKERMEDLLHHSAIYFIEQARLNE